MIPTARDGLGDRVRGRDLGADDYLNKPFALSEFEAPLIRLGALSFDAIRHEARIGDAALEIATQLSSFDEELTPNAIEIYVYLLRKRLEGQRLPAAHRVRPGPYAGRWMRHPRSVTWSVLLWLLVPRSLVVLAFLAEAWVGARRAAERLDDQMLVACGDPHQRGGGPHPWRSGRGRDHLAAAQHHARAYLLPHCRAEPVPFDRI